jgi:hypothetical protein
MTFSLLPFPSLSLSSSYLHFLLLLLPLSQFDAQAKLSQFQDLLDSQIRVNHKQGYCFLSSASFSRDKDDRNDIGIFLKQTASVSISQKELDEEINAKLERFYDAGMKATECFWCYYYGYPFHTGSLSDRFKIVMLSLCNHFVNAVQSFCHRYAIALQSLC